MFHVYFVYAAKDEDIMLNAFTATFGDMVAAMLAGMVVLPAVFALAPDPMAVMKSGANGLTFVNLTNLFAHTTGGFLMAGNMTLLICTEDEKVDDCIGIISQCCKQRTEIVPGTATLGLGIESALPMEVTVGGATVMVTNVERFEKL